MKIAEKYPLLRSLKSGKLPSPYRLHENDAPNAYLLQMIKRVFETNAKTKFNSKVRLITEPLVEAVLSAWPKLMVDEVLVNLDDSGTILYNNATIFYNLKYSHGSFSGDNLSISGDLISFHGDLLSMAHISVNPKRAAVYSSVMNKDSGFTTNEISDAEMEEIVMAEKYFIVAIICFLKHAEIETKIIKSFTSISDGIQCKYDNKTFSDIEIIDSTWFTTLIKSDAFKVRGHFRLQPHGEGLSKKKLIWISDFEKHGYTRTAAKIKSTEGVESGVGNLN